MDVEKNAKGEMLMYQAKGETNMRLNSHWHCYAIFTTATNLLQIQNGPLRSGINDRFPGQRDCLLLFITTCYVIATVPLSMRK